MLLDEHKVLKLAAMMSPACSQSYVRSFPCAGPLRSWAVAHINCTFIVGSGRVGPDCLRSTAGSGPWLYRLWPRCLRRDGVGRAGNESSNDTVMASACFGDGTRSGQPSVDRETRDLILQMNAANPL